MKRAVLFLGAAAMVSTVIAGFKYEGEWGEAGTGNGQFYEPTGVAVAPTGNVYVADSGNERVQYFTPTGSFLGKWPVADVAMVAVAPGGNVYTGGCDTPIAYFTPTGSLLGSWGHPPETIPYGGDVAPGGDGYFSYYSTGGRQLYHYTSQGSIIRVWSTEPGGPGAVAVAPNASGHVYITSVFNNLVIYFTPAGSLLGSWGSPGSGPGQFNNPKDVVVAPNGYVFVADTDNNRIQYFTATGSFLGMWGEEGSGPGEFIAPESVAVSPSGVRIYVADRHSHRIQYFNRDEPDVAPASLGKVKALFR